jgi:tetratricopeptide (TPR) repeat protein
MRCLAVGSLFWGATIGLGSVVSTDQLVKEGLKAEQDMQPLVALESFSAAAKLRPEDAFIQQKIAQQLSDAAFVETDPDERMRLAKEAMLYARRAVKLDPQSAVARLSIAVLYGKFAVEGNARTRLEYARQIHENAEQALVIDPQYAWGYHVLGKWHVELSQLGFGARAIVNLFLGGLPKASVAQGVQSLEKAVELEPDALSHWVELGFAYQRAERMDEAVGAWEKALQLPALKIYDEPAKQRATAALVEQRQG